MFTIDKILTRMSSGGLAVSVCFVFNIHLDHLEESNVLVYNGMPWPGGEINVFVVSI